MEFPALVRELWEGTGDSATLTPDGPVDGFRALSAALDPGDPFVYMIRAREGLEFELGLGEMTSGGDLERVEVYQSAGTTGAGGRIDFGTGEKDVYAVLSGELVEELAAEAAGDAVSAHEGEADPHPQYATGGAQDSHSGRTDNPHGVTAGQVGAVEESRQVATSGLATGGGDLSEDRTVNVPAANLSQAVAGSATNVAMTPQRASNHHIERVRVSASGPSGSAPDRTIWCQY